MMILFPYHNDHDDVIQQNLLQNGFHCGGTFLHSTVLCIANK